jgi:hypothetical protein
MHFANLEDSFHEARIPAGLQADQCLFTGTFSAEFRMNVVPSFAFVLAREGNSGSAFFQG